MSMVAGCLMSVKAERSSVGIEETHLHINVIQFMFSFILSACVVWLSCAARPM